MFGRSADTVTLLDVVETIDGPALRTQCILGVPGCCEPTQHCPLHSQWAKIREQILDVLSSRSLEELSEDLMGHDYALAGSVGRDGSAKGPRRHG